MKLQYSKQKGLSLIELLIAMVLGLILTAGALEMMLASRSLQRTTEDSSLIQENGRFALGFLAQNIRMGGYKATGSANGKVFWDGACPGLPGPLPATPCTADGGGNNSDRIAVILNPSNDSDCLGNDVGNDVIANVYFIGDIDGDQVSSLYCRGYNIDQGTWYGLQPAPLVDGIENMQVLYGVSDPASNNEINRYVSVARVPSWGRVGGARIALLVNNGQANGNSDNIARSFNLLNAPNLPFNDKHSRQAYTSTIVSNNILYQEQRPNQ